MKINEKIVLEIEEKTKCPILEMFYTEDDGYWYVCFEEFLTKNGIEQIVHLDDVLEKIEKYTNIEYLTNEVYIDDNDDWFEQITFHWKE